MESIPYHHGNLKNVLIEAGIELINQNGINQFSLRKVAIKCKVSHAAPYNHFKDKEQLLKEMKDYVVQKFMDRLNHVIINHDNNSDVMVDLGIAYVDFFAENPQYFQFIFSQGEFDLQISFSNEAISHSEFPPFELFRKTAEHCMKNADLSPALFSSNIITMWALVHGLASIFATKYVLYDGDRNVFIGKILREKICLS
ncbi:TetR/AcrR family transcriptional regulator [Clostridium estertheticum]|uniref:TetR/AcrR family transcriptional regulator n=1 Tax=Clostridium estertheticum TaxID=238834 RepID=UPI001CF27C26|nr:TetR/AcrR family transcriptional regulator [Clostridium estertheticum]MCB2356088.1 TetR/AcrR family transcriptional regulator [Clostridium estertheticum]WAG43761.1 TetR/AcrR family transcriptional regulator [Clostridium estertheticum]